MNAQDSSVWNYGDARKQVLGLFDGNVYARFNRGGGDFGPYICWSWTRSTEPNGIWMSCAEQGHILVFPVREWGIIPPAPYRRAVDAEVWALKPRAPQWFREFPGIKRVDFAPWYHQFL